MMLEYENIYKCWVVWLHKKSLRIEVFRGKKKECEEFVKGKKRKNYEKNRKIYYND